MEFMIDWQVKFFLSENTIFYFKISNYLQPQGPCIQSLLGVRNDIKKNKKSFIFLLPPPTTFSDYDILCSSGNDVCERDKSKWERSYKLDIGSTDLRGCVFYICVVIVVHFSLACVNIYTSYILSF